MAHQVKFGSYDATQELQPDQSANDDHSQVASPQSRSSSDALKGGGHFGAQPATRNTRSFTAAPNVIDLGFQNLSLNDHSEPIPSRNPGRYVSPHLRGDRSFDASSGPQFHYPRNNRARTVSGNYGRPMGSHHRQSYTWMSPEAQAQHREAQAKQQVEEEFLIVRNSMRRLFKESHVAKWKLDDYLKHRSDMLDLQTKKLAKQMETPTPASPQDLTYIPPDVQDKLRGWGFVNGNFEQVGNYGRVLGEKTIWCADWQNGKEEIAPWPTMAEMKWEGDDRAKTSVGRFPPLPREQGPASLPWNQLPVVEQYPMDQINKIPTMEDVYLPVDPEIEEDKQYLWSEGLDAEIWASLEE